ncbi:MAG TPA: LPS biosynthesis protein WbpP [Betaproteobacteria bacterium]|nr:LPS biosynthesis protein WbpP [Betaproteobacteria bacterium]
MPLSYEEIKSTLSGPPKRWLVTGVAGFIGSNLLEALLRLGQEVIGLDDFSAGHPENLSEVQRGVGEGRWRNFTFIEGDIRNLESCQQACDGVNYVLHQAALGSVPRSIENPLRTNDTNVTGFLTLLDAARRANVASFVYASSSSVYGDEPLLPKHEEKTGNLLSPYAVGKYANELYADVFGRVYGMGCIGLRYFNVFGRRQDPAGAYAAVVPAWFSQLLQGKECFINGDGATSRDFCYIDNVVQANILAACAEDPAARAQVYNIAAGGRSTLNELFALIRDSVADVLPDAAAAVPHYRDFRPGDVRHSHADINKAQRLLGYAPTHSVQQGMREAAKWYIAKFCPESQNSH